MALRNVLREKNIIIIIIIIIIIYFELDGG